MRLTFGSSARAVSGADWNQAYHGDARLSINGWINNLNGPNIPSDATNKKYVDEKIVECQNQIVDCQDQINDCFNKIDLCLNRDGCDPNGQQYMQLGSSRSWTAPSNTCTGIKWTDRLNANNES